MGLNKTVDKIHSLFPKDSHKLRVDIDATDALNTYGYKIVINAYVMQYFSVCEHCLKKRGDHLKDCQVKGGLHNFKTRIIPILSCSGETIIEALNSLIKDKT